MKLAELKKLNDRARMLAAGCPLEDVTQLLVHAKKHPYYGFVEIAITGVDPFIMYTNNDDAIAIQAFWQRPFLYESHSLAIWAYASKQARGVADIGAYTGLYSLVAAAVNRQTKVHAFEAVDFIYARTFLNIAVNQFHNVRVYNVALADEPGRIELHLRFGPTLLSSGSSIVKPDEQLVGSFTKDIQAHRGDDFFRDAPIDLCKVDVEGAESLVLRGLDVTVANHRPMLIIEVLDPAQLGEVSGILQNYGYEFRFISEGDQQLHQNPAAFWEGASEDRNVAFVHPESRLNIRELGW